MTGRVFAVGIGPGAIEQMTMAAQRAIGESSVVVGHAPYLALIAPLLEGKRLVKSGMMREEERCRIALDLALGGETVSVVSSGDSGVYGMAGLLLELAGEIPAPPSIEIVPGVSAVTAAAARLGSPLMHDFAVISLSDLLTPWDAIRERLRGAASTDFVIALYNPRSRGRVRQLQEAVEIISLFRTPETPVGIVKNAYREGERRVVTTLSELLTHDVDMTTLVIVGNSRSRIDRQGRMVTPRGYGERKRSEVSGRPAGRHRPLMICGTGSDVGKSVITAGLCRLFANRGIRVAPFKSQNMALNAAVTPDGGEIGRAQAEQAAACRIEPTTDMNPILLKPTGDRRSQVIMQGRAVGTMDVAAYHRFKPTAFDAARDSFCRLAGEYDLILMEGAGSVAEINLKEHDIANMRVAEMADALVILVADIDRGGVFAQLIGTWELLTPPERERVAGFVINRFRGDPSLLSPGITYLERRTGRPLLGVVPWLDDIGIAPEDSQSLERLFAPGGGGGIVAGILHLPRISNFDEFIPLRGEPDVTIRPVVTPPDLEGVDLLILPGSKDTLGDLVTLRERGMVQAIRGFSGRIVGICGGFQMLGERVVDPAEVESPLSQVEGIGLFPMVTVMEREKTTHRVSASISPLLAGTPISVTGYEIHHGRVEGELTPFLTITGRSGAPCDIPDGAISGGGRIIGTHVHGLWENPLFRHAILDPVRREKGLPPVPPSRPVVDPFDRLADHLARHLSIDRILSLIGLTP
ncbi:MAG: cobyric acid synthase [Desulfuromonadia bacterium]